MAVCECDFKENAILSRRIATGGMVLLKNEHNVLPLAGKKITFFGRGQVEYYNGGTGSACVKSAYSISLLEGFEEKAKKGIVTLNTDMMAKYRANADYVPGPDEIDEAAKAYDTAVMVISRNSGEGCDTLPAKGDFYLSDAEENMIGQLKRSRFSAIAVLINAGRVISLKFAADPRVSGLAIIWQPGMEGGAAAADVLTGKVNFSGKLTDTFAGDYEDYPSSKDFQTFYADVSYDEDIFVGYRYFETVPGAAEKVLYPFGFGLSYTTFEIKPDSFSADDKKLSVVCTVKNTGKVSGREVVQLYKTAPHGVLEHPAKELIAFAKTKELAPGEAEEIHFDLNTGTALRSFDDSGESGKIGSWIIDRGTYSFLLGSSIRQNMICGTFEQKEINVLEVCGNLFSSGPERRLHADGEFTDSGFRVNAPRAPETPCIPEPKVFPKPIMLRDVYEKRATLDDFISQLTPEEKAAFCQGQPSAFPKGTAGIGNLLKYGVHNPQTADGPAGLRKSVPTTWFPCATLVACTWDIEEAEAMGKAIGYEGIKTGVDILLAPGLNIHRNPLCGRNFEYYSEDPLLSGKMAAAMVRGVQSEGMGATLKHFAVNNRENDRFESSSNVSDRALREIYLRGFEIAVKEGHPWCIMSSYNLINHRKTSSNYHLLTTVLRNEWGFDGLVMTDWGNNSFLWREIAAGNDVKMPTCHNGFQTALYMMQEPDFPQEQLDRSVRRVLELVMKTNKFRKDDFGLWLNVKGEGAFRIRAIDFTNITSTSSSTEPSDDEGDQSLCLCCLGPDARAKPCETNYFCHVEKDCAYDLRLRVSTRRDHISAEVKVDGRTVGILPVKTLSAWREWQTTPPLRLVLPKGKYPLTIIFHGLEGEKDYCPGISDNSVGMRYLDFTPAD